MIVAAPIKEMACPFIILSYFLNLLSNEMSNDNVVDLVQFDSKGANHFLYHSLHKND